MSDDKDPIWFRASKENSDFIKKQRNQQEFLNDIIANFRTGKLVEKTLKEENRELDSQYKKLRNMDLTLNIWGKIKDNGGNVNQLDNILKGRLQLPIPESVTPAPQKTTGLDPNGICSVCNHKHADTEPRVCTKIDCNCGVRG